MGNICSWCFKNQDESHSNGNLSGNYSGTHNSERSLSPSGDDERTPLVNKSDGHNHPSVTPSTYYPPTSNGESSTIVPPPLPPPHITNETTAVSTNETAETKMAFIVEGMLSKLIDVGGGGSNLPQTNSTTNGLNPQNDHLTSVLIECLSSTKTSALPDAGLNNLPSLLAGRPISSDICHFVAHTAGELSRLLIDEIKITHKEDLVVVFE